MFIFAPVLAMTFLFPDTFGRLIDELGCRVSDLSYGCQSSCSIFVRSELGARLFTVASCPAILYLAVSEPTFVSHYRHPRPGTIHDITELL